MPAPAEVSHLQCNRPGSLAARWKKSLSSRPTMSRVNVTSVSPAGLVEMCAIAEDRDPVAQLEHLVEPVTDEQDSAGGREAADLAEEPLHLERRQRGGRFVHGEDPDVATSP